MQLNLLFKKYTELVLPVYEKVDEKLWVQQLAGVTVTYGLEIVYFCALLNEAKWSGVVAIVWFVLSVGALALEKSQGYKKDGQDYSIKIKKRNILVYKLLSDYIDISDAEQIKNLQALIREKYYRGNTDFISKVYKLVCVFPVVNLVLEKLIAYGNDWWQYLVSQCDTKMKQSYLILIVIFSLVLIFFYSIIGYYKSNIGKKYYFSRDMLDVLTFHELAKTQYEEYKQRSNIFIQQLEDANTLEKIAKNINIVEF